MPEYNTISLGVVGSREWADEALVYRVLTELCAEQSVTCIVSGGAPGADTFGEIFADRHGIEKLILKADWRKYGNQIAGFMRNTDIVKNITFLMAFILPQTCRRCRGTTEVTIPGDSYPMTCPDCNRRGWTATQGTKDTIEKAWRKHIPIIVILPDGTKLDWTD